MTNHRDAFLSAVEADRNLWQSIDVRVIAVHAEGGLAQPDHPVLPVQHGAKPGPQLTQAVRSPTLRAEQYMLPLADLPSLLAAIESGQWAAADTTIIDRRGEFDSGPPRPYDLANFHFHSLDLRHVHPDFEWAGQVLHGRGDHWSTIVQRILESWQGLESTVRHQPYPFQRLDDLVSYITGIRVDAISRQATFEVFAPDEVRLIEDEAELEDGNRPFRVGGGICGGSGSVHRQGPVRATRDGDPSFDRPTGGCAVESAPGRWADLCGRVSRRRGHRP